MYSPPSIPNHLRCCMDNIYIYIHLPPSLPLFVHLLFHDGISPGHEEWREGGGG